MAYRAAASSAAPRAAEASRLACARKMAHGSSQQMSVSLGASSPRGGDPSQQALAGKRRGGQTSAQLVQQMVLALLALA
eukprot:1111120-Alexandrium_andersonii.AAC.1